MITKLLETTTPNQQKKLIEIERIGSLCLPIYYTVSELKNLDETVSIYIYEQYSKILGFIIVDWKTPLNGHICSFAVLPNYRKQGIGTQLLDYCLLKSFRLSLHVVTDNQTAISLYTKKKFIIQYEIHNYYETLRKNAYYLVHSCSL